MSEPRDDGGPAFPVPMPHMNLGMSVRDYFAGQALAGILNQGFLPTGVNTKYDQLNWPVIAAYELADAMLKERAK